MPPEQQVVLLVEELIKEGLLQQDAYDKTKVDLSCEPKKTFQIAKLILHFFESANKSLEKAKEEAKVTIEKINGIDTTNIKSLAKEKEYDKRIKEIMSELDNAFQKILE